MWRSWWGARRSRLWGSECGWRSQRQFAKFPIIFGDVKGGLINLGLRATDAVLRARSSDGTATDQPAHLVRGKEGEEAAHFYLREQG